MFISNQELFDLLLKHFWISEEEKLNWSYTEGTSLDDVDVLLSKHLIVYIDSRNLDIDDYRKK